MPSTLRIAVIAAGLALLLASIALAFWSGCTADLKTGSHGDPVLALKMQGWSSVLAIAAAISLAWAAASSHQGQGAAAATKWSILILISTVAVAYVASWQAESEGVRQCFRSQE